MIGIDFSLEGAYGLTSMLVGLFYYCRNPATEGMYYHQSVHPFLASLGQVGRGFQPAHQAPLYE